MIFGDYADVFLDTLAFSWRVATGDNCVNFSVISLNLRSVGECTPVWCLFNKSFAVSCPIFMAPKRKHGFSWIFLTLNYELISEWICDKTFHIKSFWLTCWPRKKWKEIDLLEFLLYDRWVKCNKHGRWQQFIASFHSYFSESPSAYFKYILHWLKDFKRAK